MKSKLTVVVPVYNVEHYLEKCIDSLLAQTYRELQIICVNDGSTDNSLAILKSLQEKNPRIKIVEKKNGGLSSARNAGLAKVKTDFVMFCDSDDYYAPTACQKLLDAIEHDNSDLAICGTEVIYFAHQEMCESDKNYYRLKYRGKNYIDDELLLNTDVSVCNKIFRTNIIRDKGISFPDGIDNEDFYFFNAYASVSSTISFVNENLYNYIRRENSIMSQNFQKDKLSLDHLLIAERLFEFYQKNNFLKSHTNLFWQQWASSFWFSLDHSSKSHYPEIRSRAKNFAAKNLAKYPPNDPEVIRNVKDITSYSILARTLRKIRRLAASAYKKINISYRQQKFINANLEDTQGKLNDLLERINYLNGELDD